MSENTNSFKKWILTNRTTILIVIILLFITIVSVIRSFNGDIIVEENTYKELNKIPFSSILPQNYMTTGIIVLSYVIIILLLFLMRKYLSDKTFLTSILFVSSPPIIYGFINIHTSMLIFISTILLWITIESKRKYTSYILAAIISLAAFPLAIGYAFGLLALKRYSKNLELLKQIFLLIFSISLIKGLFVQATFIPSFSLNIMSELIQELGSFHGLSFMIVMLAILGAVSVAKKRSLIIGTFLMIGIGILYQDVLLASIGILIFASVLIKKITSMTWTAKALQIGAYIFIILSILNAGMIFTEGFIDASPKEELTQTYQEFKNISAQNVLVPIDSAHYFEFISKKQAFATINTPIKQKVTDQIYYSTDLDRTTQLLSQHNISHIIITEAMLETIWDNKQKGLLVMLTNKNAFAATKINSNSVIFEVK